MTVLTLSIQVIEAACDALLRYSAPTGGDGLSAGEAGACEATLGAMVKCMDEVNGRLV
jgi:hypothetical protein